MKAVVAAFNKEKALVGAFSMITNLWMDLFEALVARHIPAAAAASSSSLGRNHEVLTCYPGQLHRGARLPGLGLGS